MRTARLVTYPHRFGHQLGWYDESSGDCPDLTYGLPVPAEEPVIMRASSPSTDIHLARAALGRNTYRSIELSASNLIVDSPLKIVRNASDASSALEGTYKIVLAGERIFLAGLEIAFLPESTPLILTYPEINFAVQLSLPIIDGQKLGWLGSEIAENVEVGTPVSDARYGEVYFNQAPAYYRVYEWRIFRGVREKSGGSRNLVPVWAGFYFKRHGRIGESAGSQAYLRIFASRQFPNSSRLFSPSSTTFCCLSRKKHRLSVKILKV